MATKLENYDVVVVGGGLAGLASACYLAPTRRVIVLEASSRLGGQCTSYEGRYHPIDFGVHGIYPRYSELTRLLQLTGRNRTKSVPALGQCVITPDGRAYPVRMPMLPAPMHCAVHTALLPGLKPFERWTLLKGAAQLLSIDPETAGLDGNSIKEVAEHVGIPRNAFRVLFEPLAWIGFFLHPALLSASAYLSAMRFLITGKNDSWRARWVPTPNHETLIQPLIDYIRNNGGRVLRGTRAIHFYADENRVRGVRVANEDGSHSSIEGNSFVCATPPMDAANLLETVPRSDRQVCALRGLGSTKVRSYRFRFESERSAVFPHGIMLTQRAGFIFFVLDAFMPAYQHQRTRVIEIQCGPDAMDVNEAIIERYVRRLLSSSGKSARLVDLEISPTLPYARYACGGSLLRPRTETIWPNLFFAGDWVHEPHGSWFMERAVTTGRLAAHAILGNRVESRPRTTLQSTSVQIAQYIGNRLFSAPQMARRREFDVHAQIV